ncbi:hypothetical protein [Rhodococcus sp. NPDC058521]|uniref:DUF7144 family membrane protein n=1 Tax=Rhodococcus sp. NPDC058521 TaxID=3346536 RepID=UPI003661D67C
MTTTPDRAQDFASGAHPVKQGVAGLTTVIAAILLAVAGILAVLQGIAAIASDEIFVTGLQYTYAFDVTTWGWIHLIVGVLVVLTAFALMTGATWARVTAVVLAGISIVVNFVWLPYYPIWGIMVIALDVVVIWAVSTWDRDAA